MVRGGPYLGLVHCVTRRRGQALECASDVGDAKCIPLPCGPRRWTQVALVLRKGWFWMDSATVRACIPHWPAPALTCHALLLCRSRWTVGQAWRRSRTPSRTPALQGHRSACTPAYVRGRRTHPAPLPCAAHSPPARSGRRSTRSVTDRRARRGRCHPVGGPVLPRRDASGKLSAAMPRRRYRRIRRHAAHSVRCAAAPARHCLARVADRVGPGAGRPSPRGRPLHRAVSEHGPARHRAQLESTGTHTSGADWSSRGCGGCSGLRLGTGRADSRPRLPSRRGRCSSAVRCRRVSAACGDKRAGAVS